MIYTEMTMKAMKMAYEAHLGQVDYCNIPYIYHPIHLAEQMDDELSCTVALLHDVVEDTSLTIEDIAAAFPAAVVEAVRYMTHEDGVEYYDYVRAIRENPIAKKVKLADIEHNSDMTRCVGSDLSEERIENWKKKYAKAKEVLLS
ncbi:MAG: bifunctional (p)ppGpp synthetase/guanosine-3',5'-bis(diphosphate) 3'-pyrophosphohydrolase [Clostridia bacterium]|nr:bifunctional (p)ppGpp synthetase/guanosine-3',5'-bis(diphosphate) 3'-pyrophosphohydrolase [Clostridia bacterium]